MINVLLKLNIALYNGWEALLLLNSNKDDAKKIDSINILVLT